jgi:hypothetical protein
MKITTISRATGMPPGSATCPDCNRRIAVRANGQGGDWFITHFNKIDNRTIECKMSRRDVPKER